MTIISGVSLPTINSFTETKDPENSFSSKLDSKTPYEVAQVVEALRVLTKVVKTDTPLIKKIIIRGGSAVKPASALKNVLPKPSSAIKLNYGFLNLNGTISEMRSQLQKKYGSKQDAANIACEAKLTEIPDTRSEDYIPSNHPESISFSPYTRRRFKYNVTATATGIHDGMPATQTKALLTYKKSSPGGTELKPYIAMGTTTASKTAQYTTEDMDYAPNAPRTQKKFHLVTVTGKAVCTWADGTKLETVKNVLHD